MAIGGLKFEPGANPGLLFPPQPSWSASHSDPAKDPINDACTCQNQFVQSQPCCLEILKQSGWETADLGKANAARGIEPLCTLWCIPGILQQ